MCPRVDHKHGHPPHIVCSRLLVKGNALTSTGPKLQYPIRKAMPEMGLADRKHRQLRNDEK